MNSSDDHDLWKEFHDSSSLDANEQISRLGRNMPMAMSVLEHALNQEDDEASRIQAATCVIYSFTKFLDLGIEFASHEEIVMHIFEHFSKSMNKALEVYDELMSGNDNLIQVSAASKIIQHWASLIVVYDDDDDGGGGDHDLYRED